MPEDRSVGLADDTFNTFFMETYYNFLLINSLILLIDSLILTCTYVFI